MTSSFRTLLLLLHLVSYLQASVAAIDQTASAAAADGPASAKLPLSSASAAASGSSKKQQHPVAVQFPVFAHPAVKSSVSSSGLTAAAGGPPEVDGDVVGSAVDKRAMGLLRLGRAGSHDLSAASVGNDEEVETRVGEPDKKAMGLLRLGRRRGQISSVAEQDVVDDDQAISGEAPAAAAADKRKSMALLRLGRKRTDVISGDSFGDQQTLEEDTDDKKKRAMGLLRLGRTPYGDSDEFVPGGVANLDDDVDDNKRAMGLLRLGRKWRTDHQPGGNNRKSMSMLRLGRRSDATPTGGEGAKRAMGLLRLG
jgi:ribosomal protein L30/L7E